MSFQINPFHYTKIDLTKISTSKTFFDIEILLALRKKIYPAHHFLVVDKSQVIYIDKEIVNKIKYHTNNQQLNISYDTNIEQPIYIINIFANNHTLDLHISKDCKPHIIYENIVGEEGQGYTNIHNFGNLNFYSLATSYIEGLFHENLLIDNQGEIKAFFMQNKHQYIHKLDAQIILGEDAISNINILNHLQNKQIKDDCFEITQQGKNSHSIISYLSLNDGKSVSQINNIVEKNSLDCELEQHIKHILVSEKAQSYSKPSLMIHAPTVASHGNAISSFPEEWLFYLYQKGIKPDNAQKIIENSLINEFCSKTPFESQFNNYFLKEKL